MLTEDLLKKIQDLYKLGHPVEVLRRVEKGVLSQNYILQSGKDKYFLKKYRDFGIERLKEIHAVKQFFGARGIPVIMPLHNRDGVTFCEHSGSYYAFFPYVEGIQYEQTTLSDIGLKSCAELLARVHLLSKEGHPHLVRPRMFGWDREEFLSRAQSVEESISKQGNRNNLDKRAGEFLAQKIALVEQNTATYESFGLKSDHLIHGDFHELNIFFDEQDQVEYLFDWEKVNTSPRVIEVVRAMEFLCFYGKYEEENYRKAEIFLRTYNALYPLGAEELTKGFALWYIHQLHNLWLLEEYYLEKNTRVEDFFENSINFLDYHSENLDLHCQKLGSFLLAK